MAREKSHNLLLDWFPVRIAFTILFMLPPGGRKRHNSPYSSYSRVTVRQKEKKSAQGEGEEGE